MIAEPKHHAHRTKRCAVDVSESGTRRRSTRPLRIPFPRPTIDGDDGLNFQTVIAREKRPPRKTASTIDLVPNFQPTETIRLWATASATVVG